MATRIQLPPEILAIFREEAREHLEDVVEGLERLGVSGDPDSETEHRVNLKRKLHNVKGAANSVGFSRLGQVAHAAEDRLATVEDGDEVPKEVIDDLYASIHWLLSTLDDPEDPPTELLQRLGLPVEGGAPSPAPKAAGQKAGAKKKKGKKASARKAGAKKATAAEDDPDPGPGSGKEELKAPVSTGGNFIRVKSTALEQVLSPVAALAMLRVQGRREIDRLEELALQCQSLADKATDGRIGPEEIGVLRELGRELENQHRQGRESSRRTDLALTDLEDQFRRMRLVPFQSLETSLRLTLREAAEATGKKVRLVVEGAEAGLDRRHLELLKPPLMHLLRNAVDHGIEGPATRLRAGEEETGTILLQLQTGADRITVIVEDDGQGMDLEAIKRKALERGMATEEELSGMGEGQLYDLACTPGFSTRTEITQVSGRGVGLDVVRTAIEREGGSLTIEARDPKGTRFLLSLPASLLTTNVLRVTAGGRVYALPVAGVESTSRIDPDTIYTLDGRPCVEIGGRSALVHRLQGVTDGEESGDGRSHAVVIATPRGRVAVMVDRILGDDEMVVRALGPPFRKVRGVLGATIGEEGQVVPVLNPVEIFDIDQEGIRAAKPKAAKARRTILVVDDSITTRTLERHVLESHGYLVQTASDGAQAFDLLHTQDFDLIVSDVEMPVLDGIGLVRKIRADPDQGEKPVILVTSLGSPEDEERGLTAGADAYIVKSRFDQTQLLQTIEDLLEGEGMIGQALDLVIAGRDPAAVEELSTELGRSPKVVVVGTSSDAAGIQRMIDRRAPQILVVAVNTELSCRLITEVREGASLPIVAVCTDATLGMKALSCGALEWVERHNGTEKILESILLMASIRTVRKQRRRAPSEPEPTRPPGRRSTPPSRSRSRPEVDGNGLPRIVAIGGSTGAPVAMLDLLAELASPVPAPVIIAQHMPHDYSDAFAHWLSSTTGRQVKVAQAGQPLERGMIHVAPANHHTTLVADGTFRLERARGSGASPSVDQLFRSLTLLTGMQRFAVLLTGMGRDGADGLLSLRNSGARTLAQNEKTCAVFGMPHAAAELGAAEALLSPADIGHTLTEWLLPSLDPAG